MSKIQELPKNWNLKTPELQHEFPLGSSPRSLEFLMPGSLVLDRHSRTAYVATSNRADRNLAEIWAKERFHGRSGVN